MTNELQKVEPVGSLPAGSTAPMTGPLAVTRPVPSVAEMLQGVIERGVSAENVAAVEAIVKLYERMEEKSSERAFAAAFVALQAEIPSVQATRPVPDKQGNLKYRFAAFEDIMGQVGPMLQKHGFTVSFSSSFKEGRMISTCTLQHIGGHKRLNEFAVRIGSGPPGATESQSDGSAGTYAKRFALTEALNIVISHMDNDARLEGGNVTTAQAEELARRVAETNSDKIAFLRFAGAKTFAEIPAGKYTVLDSHLARKERPR